MNIRLFEDKDYKNVQNVCIECSKDFENGRYDILLNMYCNYYIEKESEHTHVLVNDEDEAVGYILCAVDWQNYVEEYSKKYLPKLKKMSIKNYDERMTEFKQLENVSKDYPAHLHIDISEKYRATGNGSKLINALEEMLKSKKVKGLMLGVGKDNINAHKFYEKNGFYVLFEDNTARYYGKILCTG